MHIKFQKNEKNFALGYLFGNLQILRTSNLKIVYEIKKYTLSINTIDFIPNSDLLVTCSNDRRVILWDYQKKSYLKVLEYEKFLVSAWFSNKSFSLFICFSCKIEQLNLKNFESSLKREPKGLTKNGFTISSTLNYLAYGYHKIYLFNIEKNKKESKSCFIESKVHSLIFSKNTSFLLCGDGSGCITVLTVPLLAQLQKFNLNIPDADFTTFSESEKFIGSHGLNNGVNIFNLEEKKQVYLNKELIVNGLMFCRNDEVLVFSRKNSIHILNKFFIEVRSIYFNFTIKQLALFEDRDTLLLNCGSILWSSVNLKTFNKVYEDISKGEMKEWVKDQQMWKKFKFFAQLVNRYTLF